MKIVATSESLDLTEGDRIECTVSHQIKIGGEEAWVKYGVNSAVREGETAERAASRVRDHVDREVMRAVRQTVETVNGVTGAVR